MPTLNAPELGYYGNTASGGGSNNNNNNGLAGPTLSADMMRERRAH